MNKHYLSFIASLLLAVTFLLPTTSSVVLANTDVQQTNETQSKATSYTVDVGVQGTTDVVLQETIEITEGQNALEALKKALGDKIPYEIKTASFGSYVVSINNEEEKTFGGWDGWGYLVNGVSPNIGADSYILKAGDKLQFYYSRWAAFSSPTAVKVGSQNPLVTVNLVGDTFTKHAINPENWTSTQSTIKIASITQKSAQQVVIQLSGMIPSGEFLLEATEEVVVGKAANPVKISVAPASKDVSKAIDQTTAYVVKNGVSSDWEALGLAKAGVPVPASYEEIFYRNVQDQVVSKVGSGRLKITDAERLAMTAVAIGKDPTNINGFNLLDKVYNSENWKFENSDGMTYQGNNGLTYALIALDANKFDVPKDARWNRQSIIAELLKNQRTDGAWSLSASSTGSVSFDITAMVLIGLAPYNDQPAVKEAVERAVNFLSESQDSTGGFNEEFVGGISSEATSQVIIGLTANAIDPEGEKFTKNGINLIDHLLSFHTAEGGFKHTEAEVSANGMATEQALQALIAFDLYTKGKGRLYDFSEKPLVSGNAALKGVLSNGLLTVQKNNHNIWSSLFIEETEMLGDYFIVQAGMKGSQQTVTVPKTAKKVILVENDRPYRDFKAQSVPANKLWTITFNKAVASNATNLKKIYVEDSASKQVAVTVKIDGKEVTVTPKVDYTSGELYSLFIVEPVSVDGQKLSKATRKLFVIN